MLVKENSVTKIIENEMGFKFKDLILIGKIEDSYMNRIFYKDNNNTFIFFIRYSREICVIRKITDSIQALNILIVTRDMYPRRLFILNTKYKDILEKHSLLHLLTEDEYVWTPHLENDYAGIFVKDKFISLEWEDWLR